MIHDDVVVVPVPLCSSARKASERPNSPPLTAKVAANISTPNTYLFSLTGYLSPVTSSISVRVTVVFDQPRCNPPASQKSRPAEPTPNAANRKAKRTRRQNRESRPGRQTNNGGVRGFLRTVESVRSAHA